MVLAGHIVNGAHGTKVPEIACAIPILAAADSIPKTSGVHALASVICGGQDIFRPKELFGRVKDQDGIVCHRAPVVIQVMRTLGIRIIGAAIDG